MTLSVWTPRTETWFLAAAGEEKITCMNTLRPIMWPVFYHVDKETVVAPYTPTTGGPTIVGLFLTFVTLCIRAFSHHHKNVERTSVHQICWCEKHPERRGRQVCTTLPLLNRNNNASYLHVPLSQLNFSSLLLPLRRLFFLSFVLSFILSLFFLFASRHWRPAIFHSCCFEWCVPVIAWTAVTSSCSIDCHQCHHCKGHLTVFTLTLTLLLRFFFLPSLSVSVSLSFTLLTRTFLSCNWLSV